MNKLFILLVIMGLTSCTAQRNSLKNISEKDGKIGIGTKSPDELLTVKGKIHTQEVLVDLNGAVAPDYVFETYFGGSSVTKPDYQPLTLEALEVFIKEHHHLPGVPSATEMDESGISLKELNLILLEKIEELTLYTLEQQKQIETLQQQIENLTKQSQ